MVPHEPVLMPNQAHHKDVEHRKHDQPRSVRAREAVELIDNKESLPRRGRRTQPGVLTPGNIQLNARPERALDVRVGYRVYCEPKNSSSQDDIRTRVSDLAAETWDAFQ